MKMYNASVDNFKMQCNSIVLFFNAGKFTQVPDDLAPLVYTQLKDRGIFMVKPSMNKNEVKEALRQARLAYLTGELKERITNYNSQEDDFRKRGITFRRHPKFEEALRLEIELRELLEMERPIEVELSFLDAERRKKLGFDKANIEEMKGDDLFADFDNVQVLEPGEEAKEIMPSNNGRRGRKSFKDLEMTEMG